MFYEFALEPAVLSNWQRARYFLDAFGPWKGRFLADYPKRWRRMVYDRLDCPPVEKARITERLAGLDPRVFSSRAGAPYDGSRSWMDNAITEHGRAPFHAIVSATVAGGSIVVEADAVDDRHARWHVSQGRLLPRQPEALTAALALLLAVSKRIVIVDPYFRPAHWTKGETIQALCALVQGRGVSVEIHTGVSDAGYEKDAKDARRALPSILPTGTLLTLHFCGDPLEGARLHNRYVLTDVGGVQLGDSIERGGPGEEDRVSILSEGERARLWEQFCGNPPAFHPAGPAITATGS